jgi:hypothetical protein
MSWHMSRLKIHLYGHLNVKCDNDFMTVPERPTDPMLFHRRFGHQDVRFCWNRRIIPQKEWISWYILLPLFTSLPFSCIFTRPVFTDETMVTSWCGHTDLNWGSFKFTRFRSWIRIILTHENRPEQFRYLSRYGNLVPSSVPEFVTNGYWAGWLSGKAQISILTPTIQTEVSQSFPQCLQKNTGTVHRSGHNPFLPYSFQYILHIFDAILL